MVDDQAQQHDEQQQQPPQLPTLIGEELVPELRQKQIFNTNSRLPQNFECPQQIIFNILRQQTLFPALTLSTSIPEIYTQHLWYTAE